MEDSSGLLARAKSLRLVKFSALTTGPYSCIPRLVLSLVPRFDYLLRLVGRVIRHLEVNFLGFIDTNRPMLGEECLWWNFI